MCEKLSDEAYIERLDDVNDLHEAAKFLEAHGCELHTIVTKAAFLLDPRNHNAGHMKTKQSET